MAWLSLLMMATVTACWIAAQRSNRCNGVSLEWGLISVLAAAAQLLILLESGDTAQTLLMWLGQLATAALVLGAWQLRSLTTQPARPAWALVSLAVLAFSLAPGAALSQHPIENSQPAKPANDHLQNIPVSEAELPKDELPAANAPQILENLVVTGEKLGRSLNETTSSVGIATREDLQAGSDAALKDVATQFANVISAAGDRELAIRGVPQGGIGGEGDTISVYLDGVALPSRAASFAGPLSAWDLEQVEVLRGAQSTNQGRNSLAGSVVLRSRDPTPYWDARMRAATMSRGGHDYAVAGGGPLSDTLRFRVSAQDRYDNGDITNTTRDEDDAGREITRNVRAKMAWTPALLSGYRMQYGYTQASNEYGDPLHDSSGGERTETANVRGTEDSRSMLHSLEQRLEFGEGWRLDAISGWSDFSNLYTIDYDRSASDGGYSDNTLDEAIFSQELRLQYRADRLAAVAGIYLADADKAASTVGYDVATAGGLVLLDGYINSDSTTQTLALFAESDWDFSEAWRLTAGLRWNRERARRHDASDLQLTLTAPIPGLPTQEPTGVPLPDAVSDLLATLAPSYVPPDYEASSRTRFNDVLPKLGLTWFSRSRDAWALTYQEGYRSGGTSVSFFGGAVSPFDPETTKTVELAARTRWLEQRLSVNANLFYTRWRDQQVTIGETSGFETTTDNAGRSHYYGLESEALWRFDAPLEIFATIGLLRSEFDEFVNDGEDYAGNAFPYAPRHTAGLGLTLREWKRISGQVSIHRIGAVYSDPDNDPGSRAPARTLVNARIGYQLPAGFSVAIYGRNLGDDPNAQGALVSGGRIASRYGEPRSFGAILEWQL